MTSLGPDQANIATSPSAPLGRHGRIGPRVAIAVIALTLVTSPSTDARASHANNESVAAGVAARPLALIENRRVLSYPLEQVWPTAIRYLRIDRGFAITDRDQEAGYILFEFPLDGQRIGSGSIEMFSTQDSAGRASVNIGVNTGAGPVHLPNAMLDGITAKVRAERGQPVQPPPPKQDDPPPEDEPDDDHSVPLLPPAQDP